MLASVSSSECIVGNMGSTSRFDYSVIGDAVNLGARLEGQTRNYDGVDVLLSERTYQLCPSRKFTEVDRINVKGKEEKVTIYSPMREPPPRAYWITFTALQILDVHSTHQGLKYDCVYEGNPLVGKRPHLDRLILHKVVFLSPLYLSGYYGQISKRDLE